MSSEKTQTKLQKINLVCKISSGSSVPPPANNKEKQLSKRSTKGVVIAKPDGKKLLLSNEQTKADIIKYIESVLKLP